jgi:hypothetical protein
VAGRWSVDYRPLTVTSRQVQDAVRASRRLPTDLRTELRDRVDSEVVTPLARQISLAAGASYVHSARAFRLGTGVFVHRGEEPALRVGGPMPYGKTNLRTVVGGAEFGAHPRPTTYTATRRGRKPRGAPRRTWQVTRDTTAQFGRFTGTRGRFVFPTMRREGRLTSERWAAILDDVAAKWEGTR